MISIYFESMETGFQLLILQNANLSWIGTKYEGYSNKEYTEWTDQQFLILPRVESSKQLHFSLQLWQQPKTLVKKMSLTSWLVLYLLTLI